jgi:hypothetical protein
MSNTNSLAAWVGEFLCRWEESGVLYNDAANLLIDVVQSHRPLPQGGWSALPSVEDSLRELENLLD